MTESTYHLTHKPKQSTMCGIVGYIGEEQAYPILIKGLHRLEYRGYDSAGISFFENNKLETIKKVGSVDNLFFDITNNLLLREIIHTE